MGMIWNRLQSWGKNIGLSRYLDINTLSGRVISIAHDAYTGFLRSRGNEAAASLAFYSVFSLFPLLGILVSVMSLFVPQGEILQELLDLLTPVFPASSSLISENLARFIHLRGAFSIAGSIGLIWSASNGFTILALNIDRAWEKARLRSFWQNRLVALILVLGIVILVILTLIITTGINLFTRAEFSGSSIARSPLSPIWNTFVQITATGVMFMVFMLLYRWVPNTRVRNQEAFWGALVVTAMWVITSALFKWYVSFSVGNYDVLYGSLATIAVLMLWIYINSVIFLLGAHLSAAIALHRERLQELSMRN